MEKNLRLSSGVDVELSCKVRLLPLGVGKQTGLSVEFHAASVALVAQDGAEEDEAIVPVGAGCREKGGAVPGEGGLQGERGRVGPTGQDVDDSPEGVGPVENRRGALHDFDRLDLFAGDALQVVGVEVGVVDGDPVHHEGGFIGVEASDLDVGLPLGSRRDVGTGGEGEDLREVLRVHGLETALGDDRRRGKGPVLGFWSRDGDLLGDNGFLVSVFLLLLLGREKECQGDQGEENGREFSHCSSFPNGEAEGFPLRPYRSEGVA
ncbi:MAG: hypothetical protein BWY86_00153 [Candidatus Aminicenantes bacterium ADurb.Bin508]|nr:MAG: hypothetical protein BWY86_00153 [Candidatus Aminicenantes bacterium ADurb.Bin508]